MQPVIAELSTAQRRPTASSSVSSSADGYYSIDETAPTNSSPAISFTSSAGIQLSHPHHYLPLLQQPDRGQQYHQSPSRQDSYLTGSLASTASTVDSGADLHGKMFRAVDGRKIMASPRYSTRKSKAYGNMLKDDVGGTLRVTFF